MSTAGVSPENLELLQQYKIDVRDFTKASMRYVVILDHEMVPPPSEQQNPEVIAATEQALERLKNAWNEYILSVSTYFTNSVKKYVVEILSNTGHRMSSGITSPTELPAVPEPEAGPPPMQVSASNVATLVVDKDKGLGDSKNHAVGNPLMSSINSKMSMSTTSIDSIFKRPITIRAERLNELCNLCDKWYFKNERLFTLPSPELLIDIVEDCVSAVSTLFHLLGLRLCYLCLGDKNFTRLLLENSRCVEWIALCADREVVAELEGFLDVAERLVERLDQTTSRYPFGWIYRIAGALENNESNNNIPPKRRSQAVRAALAILKKLYPQATAARLHIVLLRACTVKNFITAEETHQILDLVLSLFNNPKTREYLKLTDINVLFSPFLECFTASTQDSIQSLNVTKDAIVYLMSSWVGNIWLASETTSLRSLVDFIHLPGDIDRRIVIITLFNQLLVKLAPHRGIIPLESWCGAEEDKRRRAAEEAEQEFGTPSSFINNSSVNFSMTASSVGGQMNLDTMAEDNGEEEDVIPTMKALGTHVMDPLLGTVLLNLFYQGLPLALVSSVKTFEYNRAALEMAGSLLQDLVVLMDTVLPHSTVRLVHEAVNRSVGKLILSKDSVGVMLTSKLFHVFKEKLNPVERDNSIEGTLWGQNMQSTQLYTSVGGSLDMEDDAFQAAVLGTKLESNPTNYKVWNFDLLLVLIQGPFRNINRLRACKGLFKVLIGFFIPPTQKGLYYTRQFATLNANEVTSTMCTVGLEVLNLLLSTREGAVLLNITDYPKALAHVLKEVRTGKPVILNKACVNSLIGQTILRQIGCLSSHSNGLILMNEHNLFEEIDSLFVRLRGARASNPAPEDTLYDVCYQLLQYICISAVPNYGVSDDLRHTFRVALRNESNSIRLCAVIHLKRVLLHDLSSSLEWGINALVTALHDDFLNVVECAFKLLSNICMSSEEALNCLVSNEPKVLMESPIILSNASKLKLDTLMYSIAAIPSGFRFLSSYGWVEKEIQRWEKGDSMGYLRTVLMMQSGKDVTEEFLQNRSFRSVHSQSFSLTDTLGRRKAHRSIPIVTESAISGANFLPVHLAAVLCNSADGCEEFKKHELWKRSVNLLLEQPLPPDIIYDKGGDDDSSDFSEDAESDTEELNKHSRQDLHLRRRQRNRNNGGYIIINNNGGMEGNTYNNSVGLDYSMSVTNGNVAAKLNKNNTLSEVNGSMVPADSLVRTDVPLTSTTGAGTADYSSQVVRQGTRQANEVQRLKKGILSNPVMLSAARGYNKPATAYYSMDCKGDSNELMEAILVVTMAASSEAGFSLALSIDNLIKILTSISRFASVLLLRSIAQLGCCLLARSKQGREYLQDHHSFNTLYNPNAYVSAEGIPYAVSFAHISFEKNISLSRRFATTNTVARNAYAGYSGAQLTGIPRVISNHVFSLSNPVSREGSKKALYKLMKKDPMQFVNQQVQLLCLEASSVFRLSHPERKFLADLLKKSQTQAQHIPSVVQG